MGWRFPPHDSARERFCFATPGFDRKGARAPSEVFDPRDFLGALREFGIEHEVE